MSDAVAVNRKETEENLRNFNLCSSNGYYWDEKIRFQMVFKYLSIIHHIKTCIFSLEWNTELRLTMIKIIYKMPIYYSCDCDVYRK